MLVDLKGQVAIVTGGSRGIGRAIVLALSRANADVHFFYHQNQQAADALVDLIKHEGLSAAAHQVDVRDKATCENVIQEIYAKTSHIDILVNNSGVIRDTLLASMTEDDLRTVLDTNVCGVFNATQSVTPMMMRQRNGVIINLSSASAEKGGKGQTNYAASKGAIQAFTKSLAVELAPRNIRVNAIAPGFIETDMTRDVQDLASDHILEKILLKRFGKPEDIANAVLFLVSPYATYITGEILHVDGGFKMA